MEGVIAKVQYVNENLTWGFINPSGVVPQVHTEDNVAYQIPNSFYFKYEPHTYGVFPALDKLIQNGDYEESYDGNKKILIFRVKTPTGVSFRHITDFIKEGSIVTFEQSSDAPRNKKLYKKHVVYDSNGRRIEKGLEIPYKTYQAINIVRKPPKARLSTNEIIYYHNRAIREKRAREKTLDDEDAKRRRLPSAPPPAARPSTTISSDSWEEKMKKWIEEVWNPFAMRQDEEYDPPNVIDLQDEEYDPFVMQQDPPNVIDLSDDMEDSLFPEDDPIEYHFDNRFRFNENVARQMYVQIYAKRQNLKQKLKQAIVLRESEKAIRLQERIDTLKKILIEIYIHTNAVDRRHNIPFQKKRLNG